MKKKITFLLFISCIILIGMFQGCTKNESEKEIIAQDYPKIDGSTSTLPIVQDIYKAIHESVIIDGEETWIDLPQSASKTIESYEMLINGEVDLIIVPDPSEEVRKIADNKGVELEYTPICMEALVFITHNQTTVDNITTEELKSIYTDMEINNWSQLGGHKRSIHAFSRNEDSGSHALMEKFVLKGEKVNEKIEFNNMAMTMFAMVDAVEFYVNYTSLPNQSTLGYTIYYFFEHNKEAQNWENVKMLNINGIEPNNHTITSGEYPYTTNYYAVIKKDTPVDSTTRKLVTWLLSDEGQKLISNAGFGIKE